MGREIARAAIEGSDEIARGLCERSALVGSKPFDGFAYDG